ncbi:MAG: hypothetical protein DMF42_06755 [Verrucomicrobia bacterium]|nr:MAG: hypothetical protein DMF42_06755 [Verrucomicrobiota bacterium]
MKRNLIPTNKLALLSAAVCALMPAFSHNASATPGPLPISVPDGGTTVILLGAAIGVLGLARRFLSR